MVLLNRWQLVHHRCTRPPRCETLLREGMEMAWRLAPTLACAVSFAVIKGTATRQLKGSLISKDAKHTEVEALGDRVVGFLHALVSSMAALWLLGVEQTTGVGLDAAHLCEPMPGFRQLSAFSSGYFLFDLVRHR